MSLITILWSMGAAAALTLAMVYGASWLFERRLIANLLFGVSAIATAVTARCELGMMHSATAAEFGVWMHWYQVAAFFFFVSQILFVWLYLGTGRQWLVWTLVSMRGIMLLANFFEHPALFFREIIDLRHVQFLAEQVSVIGDAVLSPWIWLGRASIVLAIYFIIDAAAAALRRGDADLRRRAVVVLAAILGPGLMAVLLTQLELSGLASIPYLQTPAFLVTLTVMAFELGRDIMLSFRSRLELVGLQDNLMQVGRVSILGQLASALAHELNHPLGAILRNTDVAEIDLQGEKPDLEELRSIVADTGKAVRRAREIIDRMRTLIKRRRVEMQSLVVDDLVQDVIALARTEAASRQVLLSYTKNPGLPRVCGDRVHLSQVLLNLIVNGLEAVQALPVADRCVFIEARAELEQVEITVRDSGPGVPAANVDQIFEPLFSTKTDGLGLGLAICRTIVEAHGGRLWAEHRPAGGGAAFRFIVPQVKEFAV
jgi:signal transduction histidine kinase